MGYGCKRCGRCCDPVVLSYLKKDFRSYFTEEDARFTERHFHRVSRDYAAQRLGLDWVSTWRGAYWYRCDCFDYVTRTCRCYDKRPGFCRRFPLCHIISDPGPYANALYPDCGFDGLTADGILAALGGEQ